MKLPLSKLENSECSDIKMITAPHTMLHFYFLCQKNSLCITTKFSEYDEVINVEFWH